MSRISRGWTAAVAAVCVAVAGCGAAGDAGDDDVIDTESAASGTDDTAAGASDTADTEAADTSASDGAVVESAAEAVEGTDGTDAAQQAEGAEVVEVGMEDYAFVDLPATMTAGTTLTVDNRSDAELHELVAIRLPDDEQRAAEELVQLPPDELAAFFAEVRTVLLQAPGAPDVIPAVGDGTLDEPGRYLVICAIPTGADPQEYLTAAAETEEGPPQVEGGPPHFANGMWGEVTVEG